MTDLILSDNGQELLLVAQADKDLAEEWRFIECMRCSEYEGYFVEDLAADFARHRITAQGSVAELVSAARALLHNGLVDAAATCCAGPLGDELAYRAKALSAALAAFGEKP